jgi:hypothetical protein
MQSVANLAHVLRVPCVRQRKKVNLVWSTPLFDNLKAVYASNIRMARTGLQLT